MHDFFHSTGSTAARRAELDPLRQVCSYCASSIEPDRVDLDAALTADVQSISVAKTA